MRGMILAAGLGTRLRPLTHKTPKPLLLIKDKPLIVHALELFKTHGVDKIIINLHYLPQLIQNELGDGSRFGVQIFYSAEPTLLGTGGGIQKVLDFFGKEPFPVINADILTDVNLTKVFDFHHQKKGLATLVVKKGQAQYTPIVCDVDQRITGIGQEYAAYETYWNFTGVQVIDPRLFQFMAQTPPACIVRHAYIPAIHNGQKLFAFEHSGLWNDIGTLELYRAAEKSEM